MRTTQTLLMALLLGAGVSAQADPRPTARAELDQITTEWNAAQAAYQEAVQAAGNSEEFLAAINADDRKRTRELLDAVPKPDAAAFGARALAAAKQFAGEEQLLLLTWAANETEDPATVAAVLAIVQQDHITSKGLAGLLENGMVLQRTLGATKAGALLARVDAESKHPLPRAWAKYWQAVTLQRDKQASSAQKAMAQQMLADAEKLAAGTELADRIAAPRFQAERLQIGMQVPDIEGEDLDGVAFRLSDYRGKVVVLDFWGFW